MITSTEQMKKIIVIHLRAQKRLTTRSQTYSEDYEVSFYRSCINEILLIMDNYYEVDAFEHIEEKFPLWGKISDIKARSIIKSKDLGSYLLREYDNNSIKLTYKCYYQSCHRILFKDPYESKCFSLQDTGPFITLQEIVDDLELGQIIEPED